MRLAAPVLRIGSICALALAASCSRSSNSLPNFADLVERVSPSVVNISAVSATPQGDEPSAEEGPSQGQVPDWLKKFLEKHGKDGKRGKDATPGDAEGGSSSSGSGGDSALDDGPDADQGPGGEQSLGSGFILSEDGYILTNQHVVSDAKEVTVRLSDHRELPAVVVGSDERADIALLKIDAKGLTAVKLADISKTRVGDWVLAIGSPFSFDYTVTAGIISAKGRNLDTEQYVPFIQTDAAINPGNSGGPLFNLKGEVVGVNSQIYSQTGGFMGVAFAIPIDIAAKVAHELREHGKVTRGWLGVVVQEVDGNLAKSFKLPKPEGALVAKVKAGDVLLKYNGSDLTTSKSLPPLVGDSTPGDTVNLELLRDGRSITVKIEVGTLEQDQPDGAAADSRHQPKAPDQAPNAGGDKGPPLGLTVQELSAEERSKAKVVTGGVRIGAVAAGPGREAGLQAGDVILTIAGQEVDGTARYGEVVGRLTPGQTVPMLVQRQGSPLFLALQVPAKN
jgi:serine protease Do